MGKICTTCLGRCGKWIRLRQSAVCFLFRVSCKGKASGVLQVHCLNEASSCCARTESLIAVPLETRFMNPHVCHSHSPSGGSVRCGRRLHHGPVFLLRRVGPTRLSPLPESNQLVRNSRQK